MDQDVASLAAESDRMIVPSPMAQAVFRLVAGQRSLSAAIGLLFVTQLLAGGMPEAVADNNRPIGLPKGNQIGEVYRDSTGKINVRPEADAAGPVGNRPVVKGAIEQVGFKLFSWNGIRAPKLRQPKAETDIVSVRLANESRQAVRPGYVTFAQVFRPGQWHGKRQLMADVDGISTAAQSDIKARHQDGSVRHAVLTVLHPALMAGNSVDILLKKGPMHPAETKSHIRQRFSQQFATQIQLKMHHAAAVVDRVVVNFDNVVRQALEDKSYSVWLDGPLASEAEFRVPVTPRLDIRMNVKVFADNTWYADVIFENTKTFTPGRIDLIYDVAITAAGKTIAAYEKLIHFRHSRWRARFSGQEKIHPRVLHDNDYLVSTRAVPSYDTSIGVDSAVLDEQWRQVQASDLRPMGNAGIVKYMPQGGGRDDIGPMPTWAVRYLLTMDDRAADVLYWRAEAAGSVPWHFRDEETGLPPTLDDHPGLWIDHRGQVGANPRRALPDRYDIEVTGWTLDDAHQPALSYLPYLLTGDRYYLDSLVMQAGYMLLSTDPDRRQFEIGLRDWGQVRGQAWTLRTLGDAAYIVPDSHPLKSYFNEKLINNVNKYLQRFVDRRELKPTGQLEGYIPGHYATPGALAPWQDDYFTIVLVHLADRGFVEVLPLLRWKARFTAGRFLAYEHGFDPRAGTSYALHVYDPASHRRFSSWKAAFNATPAEHWRHTNDNRPLTELVNSAHPGDYGALARAALSGLASYNMPGAWDALAFVAEEMDGVMSRLVEDPSWNIAPRTGPDGETIPLSQQNDVIQQRIRVR